MLIPAYRMPLAAKHLALYAPTNKPTKNSMPLPQPTLQCMPLIPAYLAQHNLAPIYALYAPSPNLPSTLYP